MVGTLGHATVGTRLSQSEFEDASLHKIGGVADIGIARTASQVIAASDSLAASKAAADQTCDGTDDHEQFELAVAALPAGGGEIYVAEGNYSFGADWATIDKANVTIKFAGGAKVKQANTSNLYALFFINGVDDVKFINGWIDGNRANNTTAAATSPDGYAASRRTNGIWVYDSDRFQFLEGKIENCAGSAITLPQGYTEWSEDHKINRNIFLNCGMRYSATISGKRIEGSSIGRKFRGELKDNLIVCSRLTTPDDDERADNGILVPGGDVVTGNTIVGSIVAGIDWGSSRNAIIANNNIIDFFGYGLYGENAQHDVNVVGNNMVNNPLPAEVFLYKSLDATYTRYSDAARSEDTGDVYILPASGAQTGDILYVGLDIIPDALLFRIHQATAGTSLTYDYEYWDGSAWTALSGVTDNTIGSNKSFSTTGWDDIFFTVPWDIERTTVNSKQAYWIRLKATVSGISTVPIASRIWGIKRNTYGIGLIRTGSIAWAGGTTGEIDSNINLADNIMNGCQTGYDLEGARGVKISGGTINHYSRAVSFSVLSYGGVYIHNKQIDVDGLVIGQSYNLTGVSSRHIVIIADGQYVTIRGIKTTGSIANSDAITEAAGANSTVDYNIIEACDVRIPAGNTISISGTNTKARRNLGYLTENYGSGTVVSGQTSIAITHGLSATPNTIAIAFKEQGTNDYGRWWVSSLGATTFTVNVSADPGASNLDFYWEAKVV